MLRALIKRLFGARDAADHPDDSESYQGFELRATPRAEANGWRVAGAVVQGSGDSARVHEFVRADIYPTREAAALVSIDKGRQLVDERGERLFE